jgi:DnaK suppressor protein
MNSSTRRTAKTEIRQFKERLDAYRQEALAFLHRVEEERQNLDNNRPSEVGDFCVQTASREYLFERSSQQRQMLRRVEAALRRIDSGAFGECVACGDEINQKRLAAMPWTEFCLRCQEEREQWTRTPHLVENGVRSDGSMR